MKEDFLHTCFKAWSFCFDSRRFEDDFSSCSEWKSVDTFSLENYKNLNFNFKKFIKL